MGVGSRRAQRRIRHQGITRAAKPPRIVRNRTLIIVEGEKSEKIYLSKALELMDIQVESVDIDNNAGTCPLNMVKRAETLYQESIHNSQYDRIFIVFDRDSHGRFQEALNHYNNLDSETFSLIISYPCIEYWFLLHTGYFDKPFLRRGNKSPCDCAANNLNSALGASDGKDYKTLIGMLTLEMINQATENSIRSQDRVAQDGETNPSTNFHELMDYFKSISQ